MLQFFSKIFFKIALAAPNLDTENLNQSGISAVPVDNIKSIVGILVYALQWIYSIFFVIAVIMIILAAYKYLIGASNPKKIEEAHQRIIWAVVAIVVALVALSVNLLVKNFLQTGASGSGTTSGVGSSS